MMLPASKSLNQRAFFVALISVALVAGLPAAGVSEVSTATPEAAPSCHVEVPSGDTGAVPVVSEGSVSVAESSVLASGVGPNPFAERFSGIVLKTHEGKTVRFYEDLLQGKIVMINFMYATCKGR